MGLGSVERDMDALRGFYGDDPAATVAALDALDGFEATILRSDHERWWLRDTQPTEGLWSARFDGWGLLELPVPLVHPTLYPMVAEALKLTEAEVAAVAGRRAWLEGGRVCVPPGHPGPGKLTDVPLSEWPPFQEHLVGLVRVIPESLRSRGARCASRLGPPGWWSSPR